MKFLRSAFCLLALTLPFQKASRAVAAATLPAGFVEEDVGTGWNEPVGIVFDTSAPAQDRAYVWDRGGKIWIVENGVRVTTPLINIVDEIAGYGDFALLGVALDPKFQQNGYIYLFYGVDRHHLLYYGTPDYDPNANEYFAPTIGRITRYTVRAGDGFHSIDLASRLVLLGESKTTGVPLTHLSHGTGMLMFAPDGTLLASCGDGASYETMDNGNGAGNSYSVQAVADGILRPKEDVGAFRAQLVDCLNGKLLRLDPATGNGVPGNPFYDPQNPRAPRSRVWAMGLRNPYRFTIRPGTGSTDPADGNPGVIVLGDVGWYSWESIHVITGPGQNFGWPLFEGLTPSSEYPSSPVANLDAPNPLGGYFKFSDLIVQETLATPSWPNPSDPSQQVPANIPHFMHRRPAIEGGRSLNPDGPARTGAFTGTTASAVNIGDPGSSVAGSQFAMSCSTAGVFYTGTDFPATYRGTYFHADYGQRWIKSIVFDANHHPTAVRDFAVTGGRPVCLATHPATGGLYYVDFEQNAVRRITYTGSLNIQPVAVASADVIAGPTPLTVNFSSAGSNDPDGPTLNCLWDFGDGTTSADANPAHTYTTAVEQRYDAKLTVTDSGNATAHATVAVFVNHTLPLVTILSPVDGAKYVLTADSDYLLSRSLTESPGNPTTTTWSVFLHHNDHDHPQTPVVAPSAVATLNPIYSTVEAYHYRIQLRVTDGLGATVQREVRLYPNASNVPPQCAWSAPLKSLLRSTTPQIVDSGATVTDADSPGIEFGQLSVALTTALPGDLLSILPQKDAPGQVNLSGSNVLFGGVPVGVMSSGTGAQPLSVLFNSAATPAAAQAILRRIGAKLATNGKRSITATLSDGDGGTSATVTRTLSVGKNAPPAVRLTGPVTGSVYTLPATITLTTAAGDSDGNVVKMEFFGNGIKIGQTALAPYSFVWSGMRPGKYSLKARATDDLGAQATTAAVTVTVKMP